MPGWEDYTEALKVLTRASEAGRAKLDKLEHEAKEATAAAENRLRTAVQERQQLERRLGQLDGLCHKVMTEGAVPPQGPADAFDLGTPRTARAALATLDQLEQGLRDSLTALQQARRTAPPPPPPPPPVYVPPPPPPQKTGTPAWVFVVIGVAVLALVIIVIGVI